MEKFLLQVSIGEGLFISGNISLDNKAIVMKFGKNIVNMVIDLYTYYIPIY